MSNLLRSGVLTSPRTETLGFTAGNNAAFKHQNARLTIIFKPEREVTTYFKLPEAISVETKAAGSGDVHIGDNDQIKITDAWIVQYVDDNTSLVMIKHYAQGQIVSVNDYQVRITADSKDFSVEDSHFYIILNGGDALFGEDETPTEDALKQKMVDFKTTDIQNLPTILTCGPVAYKKISATTDPSAGEDTEEKKVEFVTKVYNPCAKVSVWVKPVTMKNRRYSQARKTIQQLPMLWTR